MNNQVRQRLAVCLTFNLPGQLPATLIFLSSFTQTNTYLDHISESLCQIIESKLYHTSFAGSNQGLYSHTALIFEAHKEV
jgi:hypothetical protein